MVGLVRTLLLIAMTFIASLAAGRAAAAPEVDPKDAFMTVEIEADSEQPFVGEMILVTITGYYDVTIALENFEGIELRNVSWIQLGRDIWSKARVAGRDVTTVERKLALYPKKPGTLTIGPFRHHLTLNKDEERFVHEVVSEAKSIEIRQKPATANGWWLPARDVVFTDEWNVDPSKLANGDTARRTVTLTVHGQTAENLPLPPQMRAPGLIAFMDPEERSTEVTREGPVATVKWGWRVRPATAEPALLPAFHIPWFDTTSRQMRDIVLGSQRLAYAAIATETTENDPMWRLAAPFVVIAGLFFPAGLMLGGRRLIPVTVARTRLAALWPSANLWRVYYAAYKADPAALRDAAARELRRVGVPREQSALLLRPLDDHLYAPQAGPRPNLWPIARNVARVARHARLRASEASSFAPDAGAITPNA